MMRRSSLVRTGRRRPRGRDVLVLGLVAVSLIAGITIGALVGEQATGVGGRAKRAPADQFEAPPAVAAEPPSPSLAAQGFDSERVWSGYDDWEPVLAADPSSSYVYQLTTRYNGPAPCRRCSGPWIIFRRSSDGGATWEPDRYLTPFRKSHNDPQIEVASDGAKEAVTPAQAEPGTRAVNRFTYPSARVELAS